MATTAIPSYCAIRANAVLERSKTVNATRVNLQNSPYDLSFANPPFTQSQLDMRRKAEILKYNSTQKNTQTNAPTKKEVFSQIMRGSYKQCNVDTRSTLVSTTASNIPGRPMYLFEDTNVPLYNYRNNLTFGISQVPPLSTDTDT
jgi:hypothetical protein